MHAALHCRRFGLSRRAGRRLPPTINHALLTSAASDPRHRLQVMKLAVTVATGRQCRHPLYTNRGSTLRHATPGVRMSGSLQNCRLAARATRNSRKRSLRPCCTELSTAVNSSNGSKWGGCALHLIRGSDDSTAWPNKYQQPDPFVPSPTPALTGRLPASRLGLTPLAVCLR